MSPLRRIFAPVLAILVCFGCTDSPTFPATPPASAAAIGLVVSAPVRLPGGGGYSAYVSLAPGRVAGAVSVDIRNATERVEALEYPELLDGGFDPVRVPASVDDQLEFRFLFASGRRELYTATVPDRQRPTVVRMSVARNATNVPLDTRFRVIFSEPIDPLSLPGRIRFSGSNAWDQIALVPGKPWIVEVIPATSLEPQAGFWFDVLRGIENLWGQATLLESNTYFTTETAPPFEVTEPGRIAFVSTRGGTWVDGLYRHYFYVTDPDGGGLTRLALGEAPAWSPDGLRVAFHTPREIHIIDADGSNERALAGDNAAHPTWSPDGQRIAFERRGEILAVNADGSNEQLLISRESLLASTGVYEEARGPVWSPDGLRIAMVGRGSSTFDGILIANADGTGISRLYLGSDRQHMDPAWSPDGSRLALVLTDGWGSEPGTIVSAAVDGSNVRVHASFGLSPAWSSDGTQLLYSRYVQTEGLEAGWYGYYGCFGSKIFVADLATGRRRQIVPAEDGNQCYSDYDATWFGPRP